jgi:hypothetical protein
LASGVEGQIDEKPRENQGQQGIAEAFWAKNKISQGYHEGFGSS